MTNSPQMLELEKWPVESYDDLSEQAMWSKHGTVIWQANQFMGSPSFYPVYRYQNYYSYSLLSLILFKGALHLNSRAAEKVSNSDFLFYSGSDTIDKEINRIGGPPIPEFRITDADSYSRKLAEAMVEDVTAIETGNPGFTNVLLCGGKDSLNLTLLPWRNPVIVASGPPNYDLVKAFIADNQLSFDVIRLDDNDKSRIENEILVNCCRNNLEHCRWGPQLRKISQAYNGKVIFWMGQLGDILSTPYWKWFAYKRSPWLRPLRGRGHRVIRNFLENTKPGQWLGYSGKTAQRNVFKDLWSVCAMWQGAHNAMRREWTDALVLSGYHGPAVQKVWSQVDLRRAVQTDVRPIVGKYLQGQEVVYPSTNPGPPHSKIRQGISHLQPFLKALRAAGIAVQESGRR